MELNGEFELGGVGLDEAWRFLGDLKRITPCLPNLVDWGTIDDRSVRARFKANIGVIPSLEYLSRVTADVVIRVERLDRDSNAIEYSFDGKAAGIRYSGKIRLAVMPIAENSTKVSWRAEVDLGRLAPLLSRFVNLDEVVGGIVRDVVDGIKKCAR